MDDNLKATFYLNERNRIVMVIEGDTPRGGKYKKYLEITKPIPLSDLQTLIGDCDYEARNWIPGPPAEYFESPVYPTTGHGHAVVVPGGALPDDSNYHFVTKEDLDAMEQKREEGTGIPISDPGKGGLMHSLDGVNVPPVRDFDEESEFIPFPNKRKGWSPSVHKDPGEGGQ